MGVVGVVGTFSLPVTCVIPRADSCTIICAVRQRHHYKFGKYPVMAGDCGDEIPSKSKPQSAGVTSSANFVNLLVNRSDFKFLFLLHFSANFANVLETRRLSFQFFDAVPLVFASPDDLSGSFFFFLNGNSFPSASTLSRNCSRAAPPRYCFPEISLPMELLAV